MSRTIDILNLCLKKPENKIFNLKTNDYTELAEHLDTPDYNIVDIQVFLEDLRGNRTNNIIGFLYTLVLGLDIIENNYKLFAYILNSFEVRLGYFNLLFRIDPYFRLRLNHLLLKNTDMFLDCHQDYWFKDTTSTPYAIVNKTMDVVNTITNRFLFEHDVLEQFYKTDIPDDVTKIMLDYAI
jgi:tetrahydromethanopterin S-methyltransferase subunit G